MPASFKHMRRSFLRLASSAESGKSWLRRPHSRDHPPLCTRSHRYPEYEGVYADNNETTSRCVGVGSRQLRPARQRSEEETKHLRHTCHAEKTRPLLAESTTRLACELLVCFRTVAGRP